jgi:predicted dinucleotide-binding enzyme
VLTSVCVFCASPKHLSPPVRKEAAVKIGILGTGYVAQTLARRWAEGGHEVTFGSRDPAAKRDLPGPVADHGGAIADADVVVNATPGAVSLDLVEAIGASVFGSKVVVDVANAATPSFELVYPNSSLAEHLQAVLPQARVVKTMSTANMTVMTRPGDLPPSSVFVSGDDAAAKATVRELLAAVFQALKTPQFNIRLVT